MQTLEVDVRTEQRGSHWVAWLARDGDDGPAESVLIVGPDQAEAERRCREWWTARVFRPPQG